MEFYVESVISRGYEPSVSKENEYTENITVSGIGCRKAGFAGGIQGTESLLLDSQLSVGMDPSRDGACRG